MHAALYSNEQLFADFDKKYPMKAKHVSELTTLTLVILARHMNWKT